MYSHVRRDRASGPRHDAAARHPGVSPGPREPSGQRRDVALPAAPHAHRLDGLRVIALFKFLKAALLIATGYGVHLLLSVARLEQLYDWTASLTDSFAQRLLLRTLSWIEGLGATRIHIVLGVTLGYTAVVLAEGFGLWLRRTWGEWLTTIATASLIPVELWELAVRPLERKPAVAVTLLINVAVVVYLVQLLRRTARHRAAPH